MINNIHNAAITGIAGWVPPTVLTNADLEKMVDTNDEWIVLRTGIRERRILDKNLGTSVIATNAVKELLKKTNTDAKDIELIICATSTPDMMFPATANIVSDNVGASNAWGYDIQAACSGFVYALSIASQFISTGKHSKIIVIGADKMSSIVDYKDRNTCIIFGDGGGAVLLEPSGDNTGIVDFILRSDGSGGKYLNLKAGGSLRPASLETVKKKEHYIHQEGKIVFKYASTNMSQVVFDLMQKNKLTPEEIRFLVPHQANKRIIETTAKRMGVSMEKVMINIHKYGNTTSGTIPLCLSDYESQLKKGDNIILAAFGGGFTWGSMYLKWAYDS